MAKAFAEAVAFSCFHALIRLLAKAEFERTPGNDQNGFGGNKIVLCGGGLPKGRCGGLVQLKSLFRVYDGESRKDDWQP